IRARRIKIRRECRYAGGFVAVRSPVRAKPARGPGLHLVVLGALCWALAAASFIGANGVRDFTDHALGRDFVNYWTAGQLILGDRIAEIFDPEAFLAAERALFHPDLPFHFWSYPPTALLLVWPLGFLPYFA